MKVRLALSLVALGLAGCLAARAQDASPAPGGASPAPGDATARQPLPSSDEIKKLPPDGGPGFNRLIFESSPYLLQHARNPVKWWPWGKEAFEKARAEGKPVFLSVGYSTCHWCHVMERESFENKEVAKLLNDSFVSVKVDREERPDVDNVYMAAVQAMSGSGGWPMSLFLTPDRKPFFGGTYFPPDDHFGRPGFKSLLGKIATAWKDERQTLVGTADQLTKAIQSTPSSGTTELGEGVLKKAAESFALRFDRTDGGFGHAPKFPRSSTLAFLLREWRRTGDANALLMVETTLDHIARGGIRDHLGGGFHRYSTDAEWHVPHFEKMLYDQALLAAAYVEAYQATAKEEDAAVAREVFGYVLRDMKDAGGGFLSAEDADSEGVEGKFYLWTRVEVASVLGSPDAELFARVYGVGDSASILRLERTVAAVASETKTATGVLEQRLAPLRKKLFDVRERRIHPRKDDKVLTDWNGLMISALARGGRALDDPSLVEAASRAASFVLDKLSSDGRLLHRYRAGSAAIKGHLDDYAFFLLGLVDLYEATLDVKWLREARRLAGDLQRLFWDQQAGGFRLSAADDEALLTNAKELYDGALPSGNSVATEVLFRLGRITGDVDLEKRAEENLRFFSSQIESSAEDFPWMLTALELVVGPSREIVLAGERDAPGIAAFRRAIDRRFLPGSVVVLHPTGPQAKEAEALSPFLTEQGMVGGKPAAYVCTNHACLLPVTDLAGFEKLLDEARKP